MNDIRIDVAPQRGSKPQRVVAARSVSGGEHLDNLDTNAARSRAKFISAVAAKLQMPVADLAWLDQEIIEQADNADRAADNAAGELLGGDGQRKNQATMLVDMALAAGVELFHDGNGDAFARLPADDHRGVWTIRARAFKRWLSRLYFEQAERAPSSQALQDALGVLEGKAVYDGERRDVHLRTAAHDGRFYIDLVDDAWRAVEIGKTGWRVVNDAPVMFRRTKAMLPLAEPTTGGSVEDLRQFVNVADGDWALLLGWLLQSLCPSGPFPVLELHGEQGSAKTTTSRALRALVDPNDAPLRTGPRNPQDLMIAANGNWVVALDNLSGVPAWLSDGLCQLATGGAFATRTLYENNEETIFRASRPIILNGICESATRGDLLDRCIVVSLPCIPEDRRQTEAAFWKAFEEKRAGIFGALCTAVSAAMQRLPDVHLERLPRMADFARLATAGERALGLADGEFLAAYSSNREAANATALDSSPVAKAVQTFVADRGNWAGTATDLLGELERVSDDKTLRLKSWPKTPQTLSNTLKRLAPNLRAEGIDADRHREHGGRRVIVLTQQGTGRISSSPSSPGENHGFSRGLPVNRGDEGDAGDGLLHTDDTDGTPTPTEVF